MESVTQPVAAEVQGGTMDCGSGLLLMLTRAIRQIEFGQLLLVHTEEPSVPPDLHDWARLAGHEIVTDTATAPKRSVAGHDPPGDGDRAGAITGGASRPVFTTGSPPGGSATMAAQQLSLQPGV